MTTERQVERALTDVGDLLAEHDAGRGDWTEYAGRPVAFIREVLGENPWSRQVEIAEAVRDHAQVAVISANGVGKDWLAARLCLYWVYAREGLAVLTGPSRQQVEEILMRSEVRQAFDRASELPGRLGVQALRPGGEGQAGIVAKTASEVSGLTGLHRARVLFVVTEAESERTEPALDAAFASAVGEDDRILLLGNPTRISGRLYRACQPGSGWTVIRIPASDVPNVKSGEPVVPGLITREGVQRIYDEYGEDSPFAEARVRADFPSEPERGLYRGAWIDAAMERHEAGELAREADGAEVVCAIDPARYGPDDSVLAVRQGPVVRELVSWGGQMDTMELVERTCEVLIRVGAKPKPDANQRRKNQYVPRHERVEQRGTVVVDSVGVGGGVLDRLRELGYRTEGFNAGRRAEDSERFRNRRSEALWTLRKRLERGEIALPPDDRLRRELLAHRWAPSGQITVESKRDVKKRIGRSPDRADAVSMAFAASTGGTGLVWSGRRKRRRPRWGRAPRSKRASEINW